MSKKNMFLNPVHANNDSLMLSGIVAYWQSSGIDSGAVNTGDSVTIWTESINGYDFIQDNVAAQPTLAFGSNGQRQINTNGSQWMYKAHEAALSFANTVDEYAIIVKTGDKIATNQMFTISKAPATVSQREYGITRDQLQGGGTYTFLTVQGWDNPNELDIFNCGTSNMILTRDDVTRFDGTTIGTPVTNTHNINLFCRSNGSAVLNGSVEFVAIYNRVLTSGETASIKAQYQTN
jgi:hypothetical protein